MSNVDKGRQRIDWEAIHQDYRAGVLSLREMASKHCCSHSTIANFASKSGWARRTLQQATELSDNALNEDAPTLRRTVESETVA